MKKLGQGIAVIAAMLMASSPAVAAGAQASSASKLSIASSAKRMGATAKDGKSELFGASALITALVVGAIAVGVILIADDGNSDSP